ncbi:MULTISPECIES: hypothetical protein [Rhizobium]|uniref:Uncharacterized protein n=1 Tax=Rhizobium esperanzae TaxID=1967781 RepID=A0A7W6UIT7_9HYPH|nr:MULTISPECIES: hypothetical protein [Rhizobium]MBB4438169.1 hypothetical protein [Rhizobium esperanzae]MDH6200989.1 hypothetical protein [Rhizobium leguminosarum]
MFRLADAAASQRRCRAMIGSLLSDDNRRVNAQFIEVSGGLAT